MSGADTVTMTGTPYVTRALPGAIVSVTVGDGDASKSVKRDARGNRWRSLDGQTFANLDAVADSMSWAIRAGSKPKGTSCRATSSDTP